MRILFVYPSDMKIYNSGIGSLSAVLKRDGHDTKLFHTNWNDSENLQRVIGEFKPDVIGFSIVTNQFSLSLELIRSVKEVSDSPIVAGGVHVTLNPEDVIATDGIDAICIGEGEYSFLEYINKLENHGCSDDICGMWFKTENGIKRNGVRELVKDLDNLPLPDYELFDYMGIYDNIGVLMFFANRGCPYECSYCVNHSMIKAYGLKNYIRFMSVDKVISNIKKLLEQFPQIEKIEFFDDTFILKKSWFIEFAEKYKKEIGLPYYCNVRANLVDEDIVRNLKESGCIRVNMAVETGNEDMRRNVLKKNVSNNQLLKSSELLRKAGIFLYVHNMVGIPFETEESIKETIALNQKIKADDMQCWTFYPFPGTDAYEVCRNNGWISDRNVVTVAGTNCQSVLDQPGIAPNRISYYHKRFKMLAMGKRLPEKDIPLDYIRIGVEESQIGTGWNNLEKDGDRWFRWSEKSCSFFLRNSMKPSLKLSATFPGLEEKRTVSVVVNGSKVAEFIPKAGWQEYNIELPCIKDILLEIELTIDKPYYPSEVNPEDKRVLGIGVSEVSLNGKAGVLKRLFRRRFREAVS